MAEKTLIIRLVPKFQQLRDERTYTEVQVKSILYGFARKWSEAKLRAFIESAFDFD